VDKPRVNDNQLNCHIRTLEKLIHETASASLQLRHEVALDLLDARRRIAELEKDAEEVGIGGNSLASYLIGLLGPKHEAFPPYQTPYDQALKTLGPVNYDAWLCWAVIMRVGDRAAQRQKEGKR
jgi:hypothetical protein